MTYHYIFKPRLRCKMQASVTFVIKIGVLQQRWVCAYDAFDEQYVVEENGPS